MLSNGRECKCKTAKIDRHIKGAKVPGNESSRDRKFPMELSGDSQLVTRSTRHRSTRHPVDSSHGQLVTKRPSTRHKQTNKQTSKPYCRSSIITLTRSPQSPPLRKNAQEIEQKNKVNNKAHPHVDPKFHLEGVVPHQPFFFSEN